MIYSPISSPIRSAVSSLFANRGGFVPSRLFAAGEQGAWYDPSDWSTLYQDSAGTTPINAVEQPVGRILDKSGRGNHAYQTTSTSRPVLRQDAGGRYYLSFDGVDDFLVTNSIDFTSTDKMTVFAGVRKLSAATGAAVAELGPNTNTTPGVGLFAPSSVGLSDYAFTSRGAATAVAIASGFVAPTTNAMSGLSSISGDSAILRINGAQAAQSTADQGTGNYGNYPLYIGRRGGTTAPFTGHLYSLIVRGAQTSDTQVSQTETWVNGRTGAY